MIVARMEKIPTIFVRGDRGKVTDECADHCAWVLAGEGDATEKLDGTNVRLTIRNGMLLRIEKRRNPTKVQKELGIKDPWYIEASEGDPANKWIVDAAQNTKVGSWPDGEHSCEAIGPKLQGNPLGLEVNVCVPFNISIPKFRDVGRTYEGMRYFLADAQSLYSPGHLAEGIVFHHKDGRRAKIKRKDFF